MRIAFVHAPDPVYADTQNYGAQFMPVWAYTLAAHVPDDGRFSLSLHDCRFEDPDRIPEADAFLFSGINQDCGRLNDVRAALKSRYARARFLIGGPICWSFDQAGALEQIKDFDHICIGDGEEMIVAILEALHAGRALDPIIRAPERFDIAKARLMHDRLLAETVGRYYGAVLEVSRGCPFLCEFCDIRILKDNNRPHSKSPDLIVAELDRLSRLGVRQVLFACDNFIGDPQWAEEVIDRILDWQRRSGFRPSLYTWLTINFYKLETLMAKMRRAGFDMLFIGIESFNENSLLETAKVQNTAPALIEAIRTIQARGFIVVAGLIFGFDSDDERAFQYTLDGLRDAALLSGDPSILTALPGTPLYRRMKLSGRLRDVRFGLGGYKYRTNIKYLMPARTMIDGYQWFVRKFTDGRYQYRRLAAYFDLLHSGDFVAQDAGGFGSLGLFLKMIVRNPAALRQMTQRLYRFAKRPANIYYAAKGLALALRQPRAMNGFSYFQFWFFAWTNAVLKYQGISDRDFDLDSVGEGFDIRGILPSNYAETANEDIPPQKIKAQLRATVAQLESVIAARAG